MAGFSGLSSAQYLGGQKLKNCATISTTPYKKTHLIIHGKWKIGRVKKTGGNCGEAGETIASLSKICFCPSIYPAYKSDVTNVLFLGIQRSLCESLHSLYLECIRSSFLSYSISKVRKDFRFVHANFICIKVDTSTSMQTLEFKAKNCSESFPNWQLLIGRFEISIFDWWYIKVSFL